MKTSALTGTIRACIPYTVVATIVLTCGCRSAFANWTNGDTLNAWKGFNYAYQQNDNKGYNYFAQGIKGTTYGLTHNTFWQEAELIEMAVDANSWAANNDPSGQSYIKAEIDSMCHDFVAWNGTQWWVNDLYDDDLLWATIAFVRAYDATGNSTWLTYAESNFNAVYSRGLLSNGGIVWYAKDCIGHPATGCANSEEAAVSNFTFVIAGHLINNANGGTGNYLSEAESVYSWSKANLYDASTGRVLNSVNSPDDLSYNFGVAIGAASESGDGALITAAANYLMNDFTGSVPYEEPVNGYNILPDYGQGSNDNNGGFNGITMRWIGVANGHGYISSTVIAWAQTNINQAWSIREYTSGDPYYLMWDDWDAATNPSYAYSWDCSSALVGMLTIPN